MFFACAPQRKRMYIKAAALQPLSSLLDGSETLLHPPASKPEEAQTGSGTGSAPVVLLTPGFLLLISRVLIRTISSAMKTGSFRICSGAVCTDGGDCERICTALPSCVGTATASHVRAAVKPRAWPPCVHSDQKFHTTWRRQCSTHMVPYVRLGIKPA